MGFRKDAITRLMHQYRAQLPANESFENKRKMMLEYLSLYYDNNRDPQMLVTRLHYLERGRFVARNVLAALIGGAISCTVMMLCSLFFNPSWAFLSYTVYVLFTAVLTYAAYGAIMLGIRHFAIDDPYFTDEYETGRIRDILGEAINEIAQMRLQLHVTPSVCFFPRQIKQ